MGVGPLPGRGEDAERHVEREGNEARPEDRRRRQASCEDSGATSKASDSRNGWRRALRPLSEQARASPAS